MHRSDGILTLPILLAILLTGCAGATSQQAAPAAVQAYLQALVLDRDLNQVIGLSCAAWEADARTEFNSFAAVKSTIEGLDCQETAQEDGASLVSCTGVIIANYGAEDLRIELAGRTYRVVYEGGEWRMCGYR